ncbi:MAG: hypothetical protein SGI96_16635 [Bacteroidota bacterium]|nr:hypothetical protein [Bacteroidota bacterium]
MNNTITQAITNRLLLQFYYEGELRIVEPHCYGKTSKGNEAIRAFQVDGYSSTGKMGWKLYDLSKASSIKTLEGTFINPRPGYVSGDKGMVVIYCEL